ncbi:MAG TPA: hypothetical protein VFA90_09430 [Terriglobales bacterium]|nr:hypothetical protein [Terriglobales bacterium]
MNRPGPLRAAMRTRAGKVLAIIVVAVFCFGVILLILAHHAGPLLRARVIQTLSTRFRTKVELAALNISFYQGLTVSGKDLLIYGKSDPNIHAPGVQPLITVDEFRFRLGALALLRSPIHVGTVFLKGMRLNVPPKRQDENDSDNFSAGKISIIVDRFHAETALLIINTDTPDKQPLNFVIKNLWMQDVGVGQPMKFTAKLINPKPEGYIDSHGEFGPFDSDEPRDTPVRGDYTFTNADLSTIAGIGGILSSTGTYDGTLGHLAVDGQTNTPDFRLQVSGSPVPLKTKFHAIVDGTNGNTYLEPVEANILNTSIMAKGFVVRSALPHGHHVHLNVTISDGNIQDLLQLAVRTKPPVMSGRLQLKMKLDIPAGTEDVMQRLKLKGGFRVQQAHFSNQKIQSRVDALSMRSQGKPKLATDNIPDNIKSEMSGNFRLKNSVFTSRNLLFQMPGTKVKLAGNFSLDGNEFNFAGRARFHARLSQMVGGWKSVFLKPVDPFFAKNGAGTVLPIRITGTKSEPHLGLNFGGKGPLADTK